jgi:hypothetical protein
LIRWREIETEDQTCFPTDWKEFCFVVPDLLASPDHGLRQDLLELRPLEELSPEQFALLLVFRVNDQGGASAALYSIGEKLVIQVRPRNQTN